MSVLANRESNNSAVAISSDCKNFTKVSVPKTGMVTPIISQGEY